MRSNTPNSLIKFSPQASVSFRLMSEARQCSSNPKPTNLKIHRRFSVAHAIATPTELSPPHFIQKTRWSPPEARNRARGIASLVATPAPRAFLWKAYQTNRRAPPPDERILPAKTEL